MKKLLLTLACSVVMAAAALAQTQSINLYTTGTTNTSGTYAAGSSFSLDSSITFTGFTAIGLSEWLQVNSTIAPYITITGESYFTFTDDNQTFLTGNSNNTFILTSGANTGFRVEGRDVGGTAVGPTEYRTAGTYTVNTITFTLAPDAPAGTYSIATTTLSPRQTAIGDTSFNDHYTAQGTYTFTIAAAAVPEPSTWLAAGLGVTGLLVYRRRQAKA